MTEDEIRRMVREEIQKGNCIVARAVAMLGVFSLGSAVVALLAGYSVPTPEVVALKVREVAIEYVHNLPDAPPPEAYHWPMKPSMQSPAPDYSTTSSTSIGPTGSLEWDFDLDEIV